MDKFCERALDVHGGQFLTQYLYCEGQDQLFFANCLGMQSYQGLCKTLVGVCKAGPTIGILRD